MTDPLPGSIATDHHESTVQPAVTQPVTSTQQHSPSLVSTSAAQTLSQQSSTAGQVAQGHIEPQPELSHTQELKKLDELVAKAEAQKPQSPIQKPFWRNALALLGLALISGLGVFAYQWYVDFSLRQNVQTPSAPVINTTNVVTPELLPTAATQNLVTPILSQDTLYQNNAGFSVKYPNTVKLSVLSSDDHTASNAASVEFLPELQTGEASFLRFTVVENQPSPIASESGRVIQTGTRDIGTQEFKVYEAATRINMIGQLGSGKWLNILMNYNTSVDERAVLTQIVDSIELDETQKP